MQLTFQNQQDSRVQLPLFLLPMKEQVPSDMAGGGGGGSQGQVQRGLVPAHVPHRAHTFPSPRELRHLKNQTQTDNQL